MSGWISIHRKIQNHWLWSEKPYSRGQAWIDIIMMANHQDNQFVLGNELIKVNRGSFITSEVKLSDRWGWSRTKVRSFLELLEKDNMLVKKSDSKKTTLTIVNYNDYQIIETTEKHQKNSEKTAKKHQKNTNNNDNKDNKDNNTTTINKPERNFETENLVADIGADPTQQDKSVAPVDADSTKQVKSVSDIERFYLQLRGIPSCSGREFPNMLETYNKYQDVDFILNVMKVASERNKKRNGRLTISSFKYFIPIFEDEWEKIQAKKEVEIVEPISRDNKQNNGFDKSQFLWNE